MDNRNDILRIKGLQVLTFLGTPPFYLALGTIVAACNFSLALLFFLSIFLTELVCAVIKLLTRTERPTPRKRESLYDQYDASTFPSAHTGRIASNLTMIVAAYPQPLLVLGSLVIVGGVAYARVSLKHHYRMDVLVGGIIGFATSLSLFVWLY